MRDSTMINTAPSTMSTELRTTSTEKPTMVFKMSRTSQTMLLDGQGERYRRSRIFLKISTANGIISSKM